MYNIWFFKDKIPFKNKIIFNIFLIDKKKFIE